MASRPKRTLHKVRRFVDEFVVSDVKESVKKRPKKDNSLYEVEIKEVDRQNKRIRIHFKGYDARFDEWRPYDQEGEYFPFARWEKPHVLISSIELTTLLTCYSYKKEFEFKAKCTQYLGYVPLLAYLVRIRRTKCFLSFHAITFNSRYSINQ